ncbi:nucleotide modification associated domain-containing protein [uncultured Granulicatella sp.]|uniref:nucleotide modification associated domain-containing protein n=1 Tax=uncultured Granulicatella sp. TaxID=316089 RepID=UPI0028D78430|nr:nucleotide modification associated domain-containing protein [uncultured Granulicatella sp.]
MVTFKQIANGLTELYERKNADYGNSFSKTFEEFGMTSTIVRLSDKLERLKTLSKKEAQVKDESIQDTVMDIAVYAMLTLMELMNKDGK